MKSLLFRRFSSAIAIVLITIVFVVLPRKNIVQSTGTPLPSPIPETMQAQLPGYPPSSPGQSPFPYQNAPETAPKKTVHVPILMYHYIRNMFNDQDTMGKRLSVQPSVFEQQLVYLKLHGFTTITPQQLYNALFSNASLPDKPILLTFDDGYQDFYTEAQPILEKYSMNATIFIPSDLIDKVNYLTTGQLMSLAAKSNITVAAHTRTHANLSTLHYEQAADEIIQGKKLLETKIGKPVAFFAYPYGAFNEQVLNIVKKAAFELAFSTIEGSVNTDQQQFTMRRINVPGYQDLDSFVKTLQH